MGTWCQVCGLPVQHDHYVATAHPDRWNIYRHTPPSCQPAFPILPEYAWLLDAVALPGPTFGLVEDGCLGEHFVADGREDRSAVHRLCWELAGSPSDDEWLRHTAALHEWQLLTGYHEQLFDFERFLKEGGAELLVEPERSARIQRMIAEGRRVAALHPPRTADELRRGNQWARVDQEKAFFRFRSDVPDELDTQGYDTYFRITVPVEGPLERFETLLLQTLQPHGVMLLCRGADTRWTWLGYTPDQPALSEAVDRLEQGLYFDHAADPDWRRYYEGFHPHLAGYAG